MGAKRRPPWCNCPTIGWGEPSKSHFYREVVQLTPGLVKGLLLCHGPLTLGEKEGDYGEPRFYSGLSSSVEMDPVKVESY